MMELEPGIVNPKVQNTKKQRKHSIEEDEMKSNTEVPTGDFEHLRVRHSGTAQLQ